MSRHGSAGRIGDVRLQQQGSGDASLFVTERLLLRVLRGNTGFQLWDLVAGRVVGKADGGGAGAVRPGDRTIARTIAASIHQWTVPA